MMRSDFSLKTFTGRNTTAYSEVSEYLILYILIIQLYSGQGNISIHFPCSVDHEQDWQSYPVDPYSCYMYNHKIEISVTKMYE